MMLSLRYNTTFPKIMFFHNKIASGKKLTKNESNKCPKSHPKSKQKRRKVAPRDLTFSSRELKITLGSQSRLPASMLHPQTPMSVPKSKKKTLFELHIPLSFRITKTQIELNIPLSFQKPHFQCPPLIAEIQNSGRRCHAAGVFNNIAE